MNPIHLTYRLIVALAVAGLLIPPFAQPCCGCCEDSASVASVGSTIEASCAHCLPAHGASSQSSCCEAATTSSSCCEGSSSCGEGVCHCKVHSPQSTPPTRTHDVETQPALSTWSLAAPVTQAANLGIPTDAINAHGGSSLLSNALRLHSQISVWLN